MRTTLNIDDDVLRAIKEIARLRGITTGEVLSELARGALRPDHQGTESARRNGVPLLPDRPGAGIVTPDVVQRLRD